MNAFITGSHAYGEPTEKSDIDLVVLVGEDDQSILAESDDNEGIGSIHYSRLNLILVYKPNRVCSVAVWN